MIGRLICSRLDGVGEFTSLHIISIYKLGQYLNAEVTIRQDVFLQITVNIG